MLGKEYPKAEGKVLESNSPQSLAANAVTRAAIARDWLFQKLHIFGLKGRLALIFAGLIMVGIFFATVALIQQNRYALHVNQVAAVQRAETDRVNLLRDLLAEMNESGLADSPTAERTFRRILLDLDSHGNSPEEKRSLEQIHDAFARFTGRTVGAADVRAAYSNTATAIAALSTSKEQTASRLMGHLREDQNSWTRTAVAFMLFFVAILALGGFWVVSVITRPLLILAQVLDQVNIEDELPAVLPEFVWQVPEVARVARSFQSLLVRLRGYRALNIRRLLIEKRRADVIAASISDGIFLLRGEELLYVNPVGERILALPEGLAWKGLNIPKAPGPGSQAVMTATSRTIPVEIEVKSGEDQRKLYYMLQSYPISEELIEKVEHSFNGPMEQLLDRWQATTLVLAQDVTIVQESREAKNHFLATLSHEVKTPVTSLTMATRLLKKFVDQFPNPMHRSLIETCANDVDRLRGLIEQLVSVSGFDTLTEELEVKDVDLSKLLRQSIQHFQPQAFERGIEMSLINRIEGKCPPVPMDATKVSWALSNLLTNALRHTPRDGKVDAILTVREGLAEIKIRDTGPGIDRARRERIFDKFNSYYDLRVGRSGSVGMGLAIAREIITAHGGSIWVSSEIGQGAEFCFTLPLERGAAAPLKQGPGVIQANAGTDPQLKGDFSGASSRS